MTNAALRLLGGGLLALAGALLGRERLSEQRRRLRCLRDILRALARMEGELETLCSPLADLFERLSDCPFFRMLSENFGTQPLAQLWSRAVAAQPLSEEERLALSALGDVLGRCDAQRQSAEIALTRRRLSEAADALEREIADRASRFPALGAAFGAILAAVLF